MTETEQSDSTTELTVQRSEPGGVVAAASLLALGNLASRLLGFLRDRVLATTYGPGESLSTFLIAAKVPMHLYTLLIGGQLSAALVPVLADYAERDRDELWRAASAVLSAAALATGVAMLAIVGFATPIAEWLAVGFGAEGAKRMALMLRIMAPAAVLFGAGGVMTALLLSRERFGAPAIAGAVYNVGMIGTVILARERLGPMAMPLGVSFGAAGQMVLLWFGARRSGARLKFSAPRHPAVRRILVLYAPIAAGLIVTDIYLPALDGRWSTLAGPSARALLELATRLVQFPHGFISVAISLAILPALAAAHSRGDETRFTTTLSRGVRLVLTLSIPAAIGLAVLAEPVTGAAFQAGAFGDADRAGVALALGAYLIGLPFAAVDWPLNYAFYARGRTWIPALVGVGSVGAWVAVAWGITVKNVFALPADQIFIGLALADSAKHAVHAVVMYLITRRLIGPRATEGLWLTVLRSGAAALAMGASVWWLDGLLAPVVPAGALGWLIRSGVGVAVGGAVYARLAIWLGDAEIIRLRKDILGRFLARKRSKGI